MHVCSLELSYDLHLNFVLINDYLTWTSSEILPEILSSAGEATGRIAGHCRVCESRKETEAGVQITLEIWESGIGREILNFFVDALTKC